MDPLSDTPEEMPESYIWSEEERQPFEQVEPNAVPVIDLHGLWHVDEETEKNMIQELAAACKNGYFQVINHGVPPKLLESMELQGRRLFALPTEQKLRAKRSPQGITGYGLSGTANFFKTKLWCEAFMCVGSALEHAKQLWPENYQEFCDTKDEYERQMKEVAIKLMSLVGKSLGITEYWCDQLDWEDAFGVFQINHYRSCPEPLKAMGLGPHTDSHFITLLYQGDVEGLHYLRNGKWIVAPVVPNALVVNLGDLLEILSNGRYKSPIHRAVPNQSRSRISVAYLCGPPYKSVIEPHLMDSEDPPLYRSVTRNQFLMAKGVRSGDGLSAFRTDQSQSA